MKKQVIGLVGSPRLEKSASYAMVSFLCSEFKKRGWMTDYFFSHRVWQNDDRFEELVTTIKKADLIVMTYPLYVDAIPAPLVKTLDNLVRSKDVFSQSKTVMAIVNNGFPEPDQNVLSVQMIRVFTQKMDWKWAGGLMIGGGGIVSQMPIDEGRGPVKRVKEAFLLTAEGIINDGKVPLDASALLSKPLMNKWIYVRMAHLGWRRRARKLGTKDLYLQPDKKN